MVTQGIFPFGQPIIPVAQHDRTPKKLFVLGVYASAVHARWVGPNGKNMVTALAVASEPSIFWHGNNAESIIKRIDVPVEVGHLEPASKAFNGPSGRALDELFLGPLMSNRRDVWLCDLVPYSCMNPRQAAAVERKYTPLVRRGLVPKPRWHEVPKELASRSRVKEIEAELAESRAPILVTLGDQPLRWFARHFGSRARLATYGRDKSSYGRLHSIEVRGRTMSVLPLVHPRQAAGLGGHSPEWRSLHAYWVKRVAPHLFGG
jgi:uracil-DNA glycosylase